MTTHASDEGPSSEKQPSGTGLEARGAWSWGKSEDRLKALQAVVKRRGVDGTAALVTAYNSTQNEAERDALMTWLKRYRPAFLELAAKAGCGLSALEYSKLAGIRPDGEDDWTVVRAVVDDIADCVSPGEFPEAGVAKGLCDALCALPPSVFDDHTELLELGHRLLSCVSSPVSTTRSNYPRRRPTLLALHQVFVLVHKTARELVSARDKRSLREALNEARSRMGQSAYYPQRFAFELLEQALQRFEVENPPSALDTVLRCVGHGACGLLHLCRGLRALASVDIDPDALAEGFARLKAAVSEFSVREREWYDLLEALTLARALVAREPEKLEVFESGFEATVAFQRKMPRADGRKALRFGIIQELRELAVGGAAGEPARLGLRELMRLGTRAVVEERWIDDVDVVDALLDALCECAAVEAHADAALSALNGVANSKDARVAAAAGRWKGNKSSVESKVREARGKNEGFPVAAIFESTSEGLEVFPTELSFSTVEALKEHYRARSFVRVKPLFEGGKGKHVAELKYEVVVYAVEEVSETPGEVGSAGKEDARSSGVDHAAERLARLKQVFEPVELGDIFAPRQSTPEKTPSEIRRVLLYGDPGSGKTCLSKTIAHAWSTGEILNEFEKVFLLPIRLVQTIELDGPCKDHAFALARIIIQVYFSEVEKKELAVLQQKIEGDLKRPTTLLVLDGLDERDAKGEKLLERAMLCECKLLLTTRPYNVEKERRCVDVELECVGLGEAHVRDYVRSELPGATGERLVRCLDSDPVLRSVVRIPVTANIACSLWEAKADEEGTLEGSLSLGRLYSTVAKFAWERYTERPGKNRVEREQAFACLEKIALDALEKGGIFITQGLVMDHADSLDVRTALKDAGFLMLRVEGKEYQFPHLTFQEFFAGQRISRMLRHPREELRREAESFLSANKYLEKFRLTLSFACGDLRRKRGTDGFVQVLEATDSGVTEVFGLQHLLLKMKILDGFLADETRESSGTVAKSKHPKDIVQRAVDVTSTRATSYVWECVANGLKDTPHLLKAFPDVFLGRTQAHAPRLWLNLGATRLVQVIKSSDQLVDAFVRFSTEWMKDANKEVRHHVAWTLSKLLKDNPGFVKHTSKLLLERARDEDSAVGQEVVLLIKHLVRLGEDGVGSVLDAVVYTAGSDSFSLHAAALETAEEMEKIRPSLAARVWTELAGREGERGTYSRCAKARALGKLAGAKPGQVTEALARLVSLARDPDDEASSAAVEAIAEIEKKNADAARGAWTALLEGRRSEDLRARSAAVRAAKHAAKDSGGLQAEALAVLLEAAGDGVLEQRRQAVEAMGGIPKTRPEEMSKVWTALVRGTKAEDLHVQCLAMDAIVELGKTTGEPPEDALQALVEVARSAGDRWRRHRALNAVADVADASVEASDWALKTLTESAAHGRLFRETALRVIGKLGSSNLELALRAFPAAVAAAKAGDLGIRDAAFEALADFGEVSPGAVSEEVELWVKTAKDAESGVSHRAMFVIESVARTDPKLAEAAFVAVAEGAQSENPSNRRTAMRAIERLAAMSSSSVAAFSGAVLSGMRDEDTSVRLDALSAFMKVAAKEPASVADAADALLGCLQCGATKRTAVVATGVFGKNNAVTEALADALARLRDDPSVCMSLTAAVGNIAAANPDVAAGLCEILVGGLERDSTAVSALAAIRKVPFQGLISHFAARPTRAVAKVFGIKALEKPVVVSGSGSDVTIKVADKSLHDVVDTSGIPPLVVENLISAAREVIEEDCPGLTEILREVRRRKT